MKKVNRKMLIAGILILLSIVFTVLVSVVDVNTVSPHGVDVSVGFSHINDSVSRVFGYNQFWYTITELIGYLAIAIVAILALFGFLQIVTRKSLAKVDMEMYALGVVYFVLFALYVVFNKVVINFRPMILPNETELEASYPSSHTMLAITVFGTVFAASRKYCKKSNVRLIVQVVSVLVLVITTVGRLFAGEHWFTDVIGSIIISAALISVYEALLSLFRALKKNKKAEAK